MEEDNGQLENSQPASEAENQHQYHDKTKKVIYPDASTYAEVKRSRDELEQAQVATVSSGAVHQSEHIGAHITYDETSSSGSSINQTTPLAHDISKKSDAVMKSMSYVGDDDPAPDNRWQAFLYTISIISFAIMVISATILTSVGTIGVIFRDAATYAPSVWTGRFNVILAKSLLASFIISVPIFLVVTYFVDQHLQNRESRDYDLMKKISYFFILFAFLSILSSLSALLFGLFDYSLEAKSVFSILANIFFAACFGGWLFWRVKEDRKA